MSILNAIKQGLNVKCNSDGSGDVQDIIEDFIVKLKLPPVYIRLQEHFEKKHSKMSDYSAYKSS
jgi:hypothetical protein